MEGEPMLSIHPTLLCLTQSFRITFWKSTMRETQLWQPLGSAQVHQSGVNSVMANVIDSCRIAVVSGGDDGQVHYSIIELQDVSTISSPSFLDKV